MKPHWLAPAGLHTPSVRLPVEGKLPSFDGATGWLRKYADHSLAQQRAARSSGTPVPSRTAPSTSHSSIRALRYTHSPSAK
jgi:hypothetical protein